MANTPETKTVDIHGVADLLGLDREMQKDMQWHVLFKLRNAIRGASMSTAHDESRASRSIDGANDIYSAEKAGFDESSALSAMGCEITVKVENRDNLERCLRMYYTLGKGGWPLEETGINDSFQWLIDQGKKATIGTDKDVADVAKASKQDVDTVRQVLQEELDKASANTETTITRAKEIIADITNDLARNGCEVNENALPREFSEIVQYGIDGASVKAVKNSRGKAKDALCNLSLVNSHNAVSIDTMSTMDLQTRNELDETYQPDLDGVAVFNAGMPKDGGIIYNAS